MALKLYNDTDIQNIADAIRSKTGDTATMTVSEMASEIDSIPTGITPTGTLAISQNGTYDVTNYASANVNVSGGGSFEINDATALFYEGARIDEIDKYLNALSETLLSTAFMFFNCQSLTSIDLSNIDTSSVTDMRIMFSGCSNLTNLDLSNFDMSNVTLMISMFSRCSSLTSLKIGSSVSSYSNVTNSSALFDNCKNLVSVTINGINVLPITHTNAFYNMKSYCKFYVPSNLVNAYKTATNWSTRAKYIYAIS